jgi:benzoyl-CoA reductase/2-hydroxyglutaryl-CoA dehydratase subunit BcrC/BadD/HgdB
MNSKTEPFSLKEPLENYLENYYQLLSDLEQNGYRLFGYFMNKIPVEILHALHVVPIRILAANHPQLRQGASERYIQVYGCSWLRRVLDIGLVEGYKPLSGVIFSTGTCDSLQNVSDIWRKVFPSQMAYNLTFPVQNTEAAHAFLHSEFENLIKFFQDRYSEIQDDIQLATSIRLYNQKRDLLQRLISFVSERKVPYRLYAHYSYLSNIVPVETFNQLVDEYLRTVSEGNVPIPDQVEIPRLLVIGGMWDNYRLFETSEWDGLVADDLSFSGRDINYTLPESNSLVDYSKAQMERIPEPTTYDMYKRIDNIEELIKQHRVNGVVLLTMKFCDPDAFELVPIRKKLKTLDIPFLSLETTSELSNLSQLRTRLAAFNELLQ